MISSLGVRYSPRDVIGRGATAIVYRGHYQGNTVAIKVFNEYVNDDSTRLENAIGQELDAWRRLSGKPHILKLIGACTKVAQPFIVSEYCIGNCIKYVRLNPEMLLRIIYEISIGLEQIHNIGVCHRDIKGNNILVTAEGRAAIADFGLSKNAMQMLSSSYATTRPISGLPTVGTLNWMSPEQYESPSKVTDRSDMWSFGMVLYELLAGYVPFYELSDGEIVEALKGDYVRPSLPEGLQCDPRLLRLLTMCWKREPRLRPQAAEVRI
ncbi:kinase-like domain-containing protein, partial [Chytriomyces sp. MP71]